MNLDRPVPLLVSRPISERVAADKVFAEKFIAAQGSYARRYYQRTGDPRLGLLLGESVADYASRIPVTGSLALGTLHLFLAELAVAISAQGSDLLLVNHHLGRARQQLESNDHSPLVARAMINWYWLSAISAKAEGRFRDYEDLLREPVKDNWIRKNADFFDYVPVERQSTMMSQDLSRHMLLLEQARAYRQQRPLEYYRSIKRVVEYFTNQGLLISAEALEPELISSFGVIAKDSTLISRVSFLKNLAHLRALAGNLSSATEIIGVALRDSRGAGLFGQVRQLERLESAISDTDVRGALMTFRL